MKKSLIFVIVSASCLAASLCVLNNSKRVENCELLGSTIDFVNEREEIGKVSVRKAVSNGKLDLSRTYVQWAHNDDDGFDYLRFATAISGDYSNISYTRHVDGLEDETQNVKAVYKGISAAGETTYSNGDDLRTLALTSTKNYYWACYTIRFVNDTYKASDISVTIDVDGKSQTRVANLSNLQRTQDTLGDSIKSKSALKNLTTIKNQFVVGSDNALYGLNDLSEEITYKFGLVQGMTTDGNNVYYAVTNNKEYNYYKYDPSTNEHTLLMSGGKDGSGSADFHGLKYIDGALYAIDCDGNIPAYCYTIGTGWTSNPFKTKFGSSTTYAITDFVRNPVNKNYAVLDSDGVFKFYDSELNYLEGRDKDISALPSGISAGKIKSIDCDDKYIYVLYVADGYHGVRLGVYDWSGNHVTSLEHQDANIYPHNNSSKVASFTIMGQKLYLGSISWSGKYHSELYSLDFEENKSESMSLSEIIDKSSLFGLDSTDQTFDFKYNVSANGLWTLQSSCTDGKDYVYYVVNNAVNTNSVIVKYELESGKMVGYTPAANISDADSYSDTSNLFYYNGRVYLIGVSNGASTLYSIEANTITGANTGEITADTTITWLPNIGRNGSVVFNPTEKVFLVSDSSGNVDKYSEDGTKLSVNPVKFTLGGQGIGLTSDGKNVYYSRSGQQTATIDETTYEYDSVIVQRLDWDLNKIGGEFAIGSSTSVIGELTTVRGSNMQTFLEIDGRVLVGRLAYQKKGSLATGCYIYETNFNCVEALSKIDSSRTLGEHIETGVLANTTPEYELLSETTNHGGTYLQGAVVVGDYVYYTNSTNKECTVGRYSPYSKSVTLGTQKVQLHSSTSGDYGKIFYYDNSLWCITSSGEFVGVDLDTLNPNGRTLTISNLPSGVVALDAGYSEVTNTLVVLGTNGNLYYFDAELNLLKTVESTKPSTGSLYSLTVSGHYVYVNGNGNGMKGVGLRVFDIDGNEIADTSVICDGLNITSSSKVCKVLDFKGAVIVCSLGWSPAGCSFSHIGLK